MIEINSLPRLIWKAILVCVCVFFFFGKRDEFDKTREWWPC